MKTKIQNTTGQILLILVMIMAIAVTVVLTITFTSRTDTQLTKLEEESQKALAAAEAGIESTLKNDASIANLNSVGNLGSSITSGSTTLTTSATVAPVLQNGEAYTLYLAPYNASSKTFGASTANNITVYYGSTSGSCTTIVLDIAVVSTTSVTRYIADVGDRANTGGSDIGSASTNTVNGTTYYCRTSLINVSGGTNRFLVVRFVAPTSSPTSTSVTFSGTSALQPQGQSVSSKAATQTGVTKEVQLFQSYPQIPAEFFFTSF